MMDTQNHPLPLLIPLILLNRPVISAPISRNSENSRAMGLTLFFSEKEFCHVV